MSENKKFPDCRKHVQKVNHVIPNHCARRRVQSATDRRSALGAEQSTLVWESVFLSKGIRIATPACGLVRNDIFCFRSIAARQSGIFFATSHLEENLLYCKKYVLLEASYVFFAYY